MAVAYHVLGDHQLAEDAAQEALARALANLRKLKRRDKFAPWLAQICRNVAVDIARTRAREVRADGVPQRYEGDQGTVAVRAMRAAIDNLPLSMREVVILRYYDNCSYEQISSVLGLSKMTINGRLTRAKRKLAKSLRRQGVLEDMP